MQSALPVLKNIVARSGVHPWWSAAWEGNLTFATVAMPWDVVVTLVV
jgi:hypothetical protein